ncbi:MAG: MarR family transcriptional regulator [Deltaproteobacteria bacterium]|nr:MarR family transcriptional regulator [Deltaproteobacteria bacterium]
MTRERHPSPDEAPKEAAEPSSSGPNLDRINECVREVCGAVGDFIEAWGFKSIHGRVWALMAIRSVPLSQTEIADFLGVSRSLVHLAVTELEAHGLVRPTGAHRHAPYEARLDVWPTITHVLRSREWMLMERARLAIEAALAEVDWRSSAGLETPFDVQRLRLLLSMTEFAQASLRAILSVRMPRALDDLGRWLRKSIRRVRRLHRFFRADLRP